MKTLFGLPTSDLAIGLVACLAIAIAAVAWIAVRNGTMFRMGIRNLPRRGSQTVLVVTGLALSTLIVTAAFVTGDTIDHTLTSGSYGVFQRSDLDISWNGERDFDNDEGAATAGELTLADQSSVTALEARFANDPDIEAFLPFLTEQVAATNTRNGRAVPAVTLSGFDPARLQSVGGLRAIGGKSVDVSKLALDEVFLSKRAQKRLDASPGDTIALYVGANQERFRVVEIVEDELASGVLGQMYTTVPGGIALRLDALQALVGKPGKISALTVVLRGGVRGSLQYADVGRDRIRAYLAADGAGVFASAAPGDGQPARENTVRVDTAKKTSVENGELAGNVFTTIFLILGLFSMAAGVMLIFMIFVMLAAERRAEMGMSRAVGAQRGHLMRSFIAEGMAYSLIAGAIGAALGVAASLGLTVGVLKWAGGDYFSIVEPSISPTSVVIGYSLGVVVTFITVVFASLKVTHVNIVAAIRNLEEDARRSPRRRTRWLWVAAGVPALAIPPVGLWFILRKGFGIPWSLLLAPAGIILGLLAIMAGRSNEQLFTFSLGISLIPLCLAAIARRFGAASRPTWSAVGGALVAYWLMPSAVHRSLFGNFDSDIEMFPLSGIMIVIGFTLLIVFNARVLTGLFTRSHGGAAGYGKSAHLALLAVAFATTGVLLGDRAEGLGQVLYLPAGLSLAGALLAAIAARQPQLAPALKMAVAYPLANRFRTGMTIAMFSLIVFSLTVFSILQANFDQLNTNARSQGGMEIVATISPSSAVTDVKQALAQLGAPEAAAIAGSGRTTIAAGSPSLVRQPGKAQDGVALPVVAADAAFFDALAVGLEARATAFASDADVLAAVRDDKHLALVERGVVGENGNGDSPFVAEGVQVKDGTFAPFDIQIISPETGRITTLTVVGALAAKLPATMLGGVIINATSFQDAFGANPVFQREYLRLIPGADAKSVAQGIQDALATRGVGADSTKQLLQDKANTDAVFVRMMQSFMALGLFVGIAGLGVIAFRSVVERRQQIGMLRAIGYQRSIVSLTFMLESGFIAAMGILSGIVGGAILGWNLMTSDSFQGTAGLEFTIPWKELAVVIATSFAAALVMSWWPSRGAARVPVAEALRYE